MNTRPATPALAHYELRVEGHLDEHWSRWFDGLTLFRDGDGTTMLRGPVTDQAELHGLIARVRDIGATLVSVRATGTRDCHDGPMTSPLDEISWPARTDRLTIRRATLDDLEAIWAYRRLEDVSRWLTRAPKSLDEFRPHLEDPTSLAKTLVIERDGELIGELMLQIDDAWAQAEVEGRARGVQAELGWVLHPDHAGNGYATEAVRELVRVCFEDLGLRRVTANCFAANEASARLMQRVGMRREIHTLRESLHRSGEWLDGMGYALLAEEWRDNERGMT